MKSTLIYTVDLNNQKVVKPLNVKAIKRYLVFFFFILPFFILTFFVLKINLKIYSLGKEIRYIEYENRKLGDEKIKILLKKEELLYPKKIEDKAKEKGYIKVEEKKVVFYNEP